MTNNTIKKRYTRLILGSVILNVICLAAIFFLVQNQENGGTGLGIVLIGLPLSGIISLVYIALVLFRFHNVIFHSAISFLTVAVIIFNIYEILFVTYLSLF